jgi:hypothetical protein
MRAKRYETAATRYLNRYSARPALTACRDPCVRDRRRCAYRPLPLSRDASVPPSCRTRSRGSSRDGARRSQAHSSHLVVTGIVAVTNVKAAGRDRPEPMKSRDGAEAEPVPYSGVGRGREGGIVTAKKSSKARTAAPLSFSLLIQLPTAARLAWRVPAARNVGAAGGADSQGLVAPTWVYFPPNRPDVDPGRWARPRRSRPGGGAARPPPRPCPSPEPPSSSRGSRASTGCRCGPPAV